jgi:hypothetical protein
MVKILHFAKWKSGPTGYLVGLQWALLLLEHISNRIGKLMHVAYTSSTGSISQIPENHMHHQSQQVCGNCNTPLKTTIYFSETHKIYAVDVTDRNVTLSRTVKIQGSVCATTLHLKGLVYYGKYHFTCQFIDESGNIGFHDGMTIGRISTREDKFGTVSQPNLKVCYSVEINSYTL